jgi:hypothetical protein
LIYRAIVATLLLMALAITWGVHRRNTAFTARLGPLPDAPATMFDLDEPDLPTPQLFRLAIDREGVVFGLIHPAEGFGVSGPELSLLKPVVPQPVLMPERRPANPPPGRYHLSGIELLLLRNTRVVAGQPNE